MKRAKPMKNNHFDRFEQALAPYMHTSDAELRRRQLVRALKVLMDAGDDLGRPGGGPMVRFGLTMAEAWREGVRYIIRQSNGG